MELLVMISGTIVAKARDSGMTSGRITWRWRLAEYDILLISENEQ